MADFNSDHKQDIVIATGNSFAVLTGNGDGTFQPPSFLVTGTFAANVAAGDLNGDGKPEVVGIDFCNLNLTVFINTTP